MALSDLPSLRDLYPDLAREVAAQRVPSLQELYDQRDRAEQARRRGLKRKMRALAAGAELEAVARKREKLKRKAAEHQALLHKLQAEKARVAALQPQAARRPAYRTVAAAARTQGQPGRVFSGPFGPMAFDTVLSRG